MSESPIDLVVGLGSVASSGWRRILQQEGLEYRTENVATAPVVVLEDELPDWTENYISAGGIAILSGAPIGGDLLARSIEAVVHGFERPDSPVFCVAPSLARLFYGKGVGLCRLHERRVVKNGMDPGRFPLIVQRKIGRGQLLYSGIPLTRLLMAHGDTLRQFSPYSAVTERVSSVDKADIADTLVWLLRSAFRAAGLPYVHPVRFPHGARSVLITRIDVDGIYGERCKTITEVASTHGVPLSIFLNRRSCEEHPGILPVAGGLESPEHEIGQHASTHNLFDTPEENLANLRDGADWFEQQTGRVPHSFVAPRGMWNPALGTALVTMGYRYSSDFGLEFDSLPFRVPGSGILQIPVHPYSPERAVIHSRESGGAAVTPRMVADHYLAVMHQQVAANRPTHIYGHPEVLGAMAEEVLPRVFADARRRRIPPMTLAGMAKWWEHRETVGVRAQLQSDTKTLIVDYRGKPVPVEVLGAGGAEVAIVGNRVSIPQTQNRVLLSPIGAVSGVG